MTPFLTIFSIARQHVYPLLFLGLLLSSWDKLSAQHSLQNDEFNQAATLPQWYNINNTEGWNAEQLEQFNINTSTPGNLMMLPYTSVWFRDKRGPFLYKNIDGNFVFTTQVSVSSRTGTGPPSVPYSLAGSMIRAPKTLSNGAAGWVPGQENYVFLSLGYANPALCNNCPAPHFEVKTTVDSGSTLYVTPLASQIVTIRLVRIDQTIIVLYQLPGQPFVVHRRFSRPDLPTITQVGMVSYTDWDKASTYTNVFHNSHVLNSSLSPDPTSGSGIPFRPDIRANFNFARFDEINRPTSLAGLDLGNPSQVSNAALLEFLGYSTVPANYAPLAGQYISVWVPGDTSQYLLMRQNWSAFTSQWGRLRSRGRRLCNVETYDYGGQRVYNGVFQPDSAASHFYQYTSWSSFNNRVNILRAQDKKLVDLETFRSGSTQHYVGVWRAGTEAQVIDRALSWEQLPARANELATQGYRLIDIDVDQTSSQTRFFCLWEASTGTYTYYRSNNWNTFLQHNEAEVNAGRQLIDIETYQVGSQRWYLGVWRQGAPAAIIALHSSWEALQASWQTRSKQGYQLAELEKY